MNVILLFGSILGFTAMIMAAYVDHSLAAHFSEKSLSSILTAVRYQQFYALLICAIGLGLSWQTNRKIGSRLTLSAYVFLIGIILFSSGIYLSTILQMSGIIYLTPIGGITLMLGWLCLMRAALLKIK